MIAIECCWCKWRQTSQENSFLTILTRANNYISLETESHDSLSLSHTTYTQTCILLLTLFLSLSFFLSDTHILLSHTFSLSHSLSNTHSLSFIHTFTLFRCLVKPQISHEQVHQRLDKARLLVSDLLCFSFNSLLFCFVLRFPRKQGKKTAIKYLHFVVKLS